MSSSNSTSELGQLLVNFSEDGAYPEEEATSASRVDDLILPAALEILQNARQDLESEIKALSRESAPDVDSWIVHAKTIQSDIQESKKLANNIARKAQEEDQRLEMLQEQEKYAQFLQKEVSFQDQLLVSLHALQEVHRMLNEAEDLAVGSQITEALQKLDAAEDACAKITMEGNARAIQLLQIRHAELRTLIRGEYVAAWNALVAVDPIEGILEVCQSRSRVIIDLSTALKGLQTFHDVQQAAQKLCEDIEAVFIKPRIDIHNASPRSMKIEKQSISLASATDRTLKSLFADLRELITFLDQSLPSDFVPLVSSIMMPTLSQRILETWLYTAVPATLDDMVDYQKALALAHGFADTLDDLKWPGSDAFHDWVVNAPRIWLNKRREIDLDWTRNQISLGVSTPHIAERVEKEMVDRDEAKELGAANSGSAANQEWDSAWGSDDGTDDAPVQNGERHHRSLDEERKASAISISEELAVTKDEDEDEDDGADAWGWGDEDVAATPAVGPLSHNDATNAVNASEALSLPTREMTLSEKYWISSMPQPLLSSIKKLYEDGARLTQPETEHVPISAAAPGLFSLPTLVLAMYRAISPSYYVDHPGGNMYLYNDAMWLAENFAKFLAEWNGRTDLTPRAYGMVKLEPEIKVLNSFGKRAYTNELTEQRLIINDLFGGTHNFFQQDVAPGKHSLDENINTVIRHVREQSAVWKEILPYSAWASATGSLVNTVATRIITDVFDLSDISVDDAERIATVISRVETMDDMFLKSSLPGYSASSGAEIPLTSRFADQWFKMIFLSEFLQSNLDQLKFLWIESDFSLYFTMDEVMELIGLSFEKNQAVRATIREIRDHPFPKGV